MIKKIVYLSLVLFLFSFSPLKAADIKPGDLAPPFTTQDESGVFVSLKDFRGKNVILYFYPKDDTSGCTAEAKGFGKYFEEFKKKNTVILGVSFDSLASHQQFKEKHQLPFKLLIDPDKKIAKAYGASGIFFASRDTIWIDPKGKIVKIFRGVDAETHPEELLKQLP